MICESAFASVCTIEPITHVYAAGKPRISQDPDSLEEKKAATGVTAALSWHQYGRVQKN